MYASGLSTSDPAMFYQHLSTLAFRPWFRPRSVRAFQRAFLQGYGRPEWVGDPLFALCRLRFKLSRMDAESGRKWPQFSVAQPVLPASVAPGAARDRRTRVGRGMTDPLEVIRAVEGAGAIRGLKIVSAVPRPASTVWRAVGEVAGRPRRLIVKRMDRLRPEDEAAAGAEERVRKEFETLRWLRRELAGCPGLGVPEPVACLPEERILVLVEEEGDTLQQLVLRDGGRDPGRAERACREAGRWLVAFQEAGSGGGAPLDLDGLLAYNEWRLGRLLERGTIVGSLAEEVRRHSRALASRVAGARQVLVHGDYGPSNILFRDGALVVLDFAMVERGPAVQDLTYCHEHLERFLRRAPGRGRPRRGRIRRLQRALLEGYAPGLGPADPLFRLGQLRHHLNYLVNLHEPVRGARRLAQRAEIWLGVRGLRRWLEGRGVSPVTARG